MQDTSFLNSKMTIDTGDLPHHPSICNRSKSLVNKMKSKGKFEHCFVDRLGSLDPLSRKVNNKQNYIIQVNAQHQKRNQIQTNTKSNIMLGKKFKSDFRERLCNLFGGQDQEAQE